MTSSKINIQFWNVSYGKEQRLSFHLSIYPISLVKNSKIYRCLHFNPFFHTKHVILTGFSRKYADVITFFGFFRLFIKFHVILHIHTKNYAHCAFCSRNNRGGQICTTPLLGRIWGGVKYLGNKVYI